MFLRYVGRWGFRRCGGRFEFRLSRASGRSVGRELCLFLGGLGSLDSLRCRRGRLLRSTRTGGGCELGRCRHRHRGRKVGRRHGAGPLDGRRRAVGPSARRGGLAARAQVHDPELVLRRLEGRADRHEDELVVGHEVFADDRREACPEGGVDPCAQIVEEYHRGRFAGERPHGANEREGGGETRTELRLADRVRGPPLAEADPRIAGRILLDGHADGLGEDPAQVRRDPLRGVLPRDPALLGPKPHAGHGLGSGAPTTRIDDAKRLALARLRGEAADDPALRTRLRGDLRGDRVGADGPVRRPRGEVAPGGMGEERVGPGLVGRRPEEPDRTKEGRSARCGATANGNERLLDRDGTEALEAPVRWNCDLDQALHVMPLPVMMAARLAVRAH